MSLDLAFDDGQLAIAEAVAAFCRDHCGPEVVRSLHGRCPDALWAGLAELGVLGLGAPEPGGDGDTGPLELVAAFEALGAAGFPGPLVDGVIGCQVLAAEECLAVARGELRVSVGTARLAPFVPGAQVLLEVAGDAIHRAPFAGGFEQVEGPGEEPLARGVRRRIETLTGAAPGLSLGRLALAAFLVGAGRRVIAIAAEHARTRIQFGQPIGAFQAVSHPLADATVGVSSAETLCHAAACALDPFVRGAPSSPEAPDGALAAAAWLAARRAALDAAHTAHQVLGAHGMTLEGPIHHLTGCIAKRASHPIGTSTCREAVLAFVAQRECATVGEARP